MIRPTSPIPLLTRRGAQQTGRFLTSYSPPPFFFFNFWPHPAACGALVPRPGRQPAPRSGRRSLNRWTAREVPETRNFKFIFLRKRKALQNHTHSNPCSPVYGSPCLSVALVYHVHLPSSSQQNLPRFSPNPRPA